MVCERKTPTSLRDLLKGRVVEAAYRILYRYRGRLDESNGGIEILWHDSGVTLFEAGVDWTLDIGDSQWVDPCLNNTIIERAEIEDEYGLQERHSLKERSAINKILEKEVLDVEEIENEQKETVGVIIMFGECELTILVHDGDLQVSVRIHR